MVKTKARSCTGKATHESRTQALGHIHALARHGAAFTRYDAYRCRHCGAWHIGHRRNVKRKAW